MTEVYKALLQLDCEWRTVDPYRLRTRWRPNAGVSPKGGEPRNARLAPDYVVRVTLTLYKGPTEHFPAGLPERRGRLLRVHEFMR